MSPQIDPALQGFTTRPRRAAAVAAAAVRSQAQSQNSSDTDSHSVAITTGRRATKTVASGSRKRPAPTRTAEMESGEDSEFVPEANDENDEGAFTVEPPFKKQFMDIGDDDDYPEEVPQPVDAWLAAVSQRRHPHVPMGPIERRNMENGVGRGLIPWTRPHMDDKLLLIMTFELARHQIEVPWDEIAHRLHPGSSGSAIHQHLARIRLEIGGRGHLVPPMIPKTNGSGFSTDPKIRGYIREDDPETGDVQLVPIGFDEVCEDRKVNLPDAFDAHAKLAKAESIVKSSKPRGRAYIGKPRSTAIPKSRKKQPAASRSSTEESEYSPETSARTRRQTGAKTLPIVGGKTARKTARKTIVVAAPESDHDQDADEEPNSGDDAEAASAAARTGTTSPETAASGPDDSVVSENSRDISEHASLNLLISADSAMDGTHMFHSSTFTGNSGFDMGNMGMSGMPTTDANGKVTYPDYLQSGAGNGSPIVGFHQTMAGFTDTRPAPEFAGSNQFELTLDGVEFANYMADRDTEQQE